MGIGKLFKSLFQGSTAESARAVESVEYKEFTIEASPINEDGKYRTAGYISGVLDGEDKRVQFIRADINSDIQIAVEHSFSKGRQIIDEQGSGLLGRSNL